MSLLLLVGKSFQIQEHSQRQSGEENSSSGRFNHVGRLQQSSNIQMKNSLHQTAFLNAPESQRIFPTTVGTSKSEIPIQCRFNSSFQQSVMVFP